MSDSLSTLAGLLVGGPTAIVIKATLVLASAALAVVMFRRASAAFRHLIWLLGLSACAALALLSPAAPTIAVDVPVRTAIEQLPRTGARSINASARRRHLATTVVSVGAGSSIPVAITVAPPMSGEPVDRVDVSRAIASYAPVFVLGVWIVGCLTILARCVLGHRRIRRVIDAAEPLASAEWNAALETASIDLRFRGGVDLLVSDALPAPITSGFFRPIILLPTECASWDAERRRIVLTHELAHIARLDYAAQLVGTIACALFWFHPAVWFAAAQLRAEAEHAADDRVLAAGTLGVTYATHLLDLARGDHSRTLSPAMSVGMIRSSHLEGRFRAMLDSTRSRAAVTPRFQAAAATLMLCAMIPAAGLRTVARAAPTPTTIGVPVTAMVPESSDLVDVVTTAATRVAVAARTTSNILAAKIQSADDSTFEQTIDASAGERLSLDLPTGAAIVLHGWDEPRIRLVARLSGRDWRDTRVELSRASGGVRLRSDFATRRDNQMTSHRFELWVPRQIDVSMSSAGGSLSINDLSGEFTGQTGGGGITIERARGHASLSTGGGPVNVTNSELSGTVSTGGGRVEISNVTGGLRGSSGGGEVIVSDGLGATAISGQRGVASTVISGNGRTIQVGEPDGGFGSRVTTSISTNSTTKRGQTVTTTNADGIVTTIGGGEGRGFGSGGMSISKAGGEIVIDDLPRGGNLNTGGGQIFVRSSGASVSASTGGGDVELQRVAGDASVSTGAGDVEITIVNSNGTEHSVDVFSGKGRVVLYLPADIDARFELESAYTENFNRRTTIESDFALDRSETGEWDDRYGTPRKFVRARGVFGRGAGLIRVRTVNGDVVVRRR